MASIYGLTGSLALTANTANQVVCGLVAGSGTDGLLVWLDVTMDAAVPAQGVKLQLVRYTGGIPTLTSYTPNRMSAQAQNTASTMTAWVPPVTATPTGPTVVRTWYLQPAGGTLIQWPLGREDYLIAGATQWLAVVASTPAGVSPDLAVNLMWEE